MLRTVVDALGAPAGKQLLTRVAQLSCLALALAVIPCSADSKKAGAKLSVNKKEFDFGTIYGGEIRSLPITLKNIGDDTLRIFRIDVSCGCTTVNHKKHQLKPGESEAMKIDFNSTGFKGKVTKFVSIQSNDSATPSVKITFHAEILYEFEIIQPRPTINLGKIPIHKQHRSKVTLKNVARSPLAIEGGSDGSKEIWVESERKVVNPGHTVAVTLVVRPQREGFDGRRVFLSTNSKRQHRIPMRVVYTGVAQ